MYFGFCQERKQVSKEQTELPDVLSFYFVDLFYRDNPSERLGNLKNGVKDIQKHK